MDIAKTEVLQGELSRQLNEYSSKVMSLVNATRLFFDNTLDEATSLIARVKDEHLVLREKYRKYDEEWETGKGFYLFANMTRDFLREVNHSRILAKFLRPKTL